MTYLKSYLLTILLLVVSEDLRNKKLWKQTVDKMVEDLRHRRDVCKSRRKGGWREVDGEEWAENKVRCDLYERAVILNTLLQGK